MRSRTIYIIVFLVVLLPILLLLSSSIYFVKETENVVVTRFGEVQHAVYSGFDKPVNKDERIKKLKQKYSEGDEEIKTGAGLYFKVPFIEQVHSFTARLIPWNGKNKNVSTMDLRTLNIKSVGFYRIVDVITFYRRFKGASGKDRIGGVIDRQIEDELSRTRLIEAVRNENLELEERVKKRLEQADEEQEEREAAKIRYGRKELIRRILKGKMKDKEGKSDESLQQNLMNRFGVELIDVMFTQLNYTKEVRQNVYERMISERKRIAARYRARGEQQKREILGEVERQKDEMLSTAEREVKNILGKAERDRIKIHAEAFSRNPEFFRFFRSLETYRESLGQNAFFLLSNDNRLLQFTTDDQIKALPDSERGGDDSSGN